MASTAIFYDICPKCGGDLISSVSRNGLEVAQCNNCRYEPTEEEYKEICEAETKD